MFNIDNIPDILIKRFMVDFHAGDYLFRQHDKGNCMYIILSGSVQLSHQLENIERLVEIMSPGEIIGEKAICSEHVYRRSFSALAKTDVSCLEFEFKDLKLIQSRLSDFSTKILGVVIQRLDKSNHLNSILQLRGETERLVHFLVYHAQYYSEKGLKGLEIEVTTRMICDNANLEEEFINHGLDLLVKQKLLIKTLSGYVLPDEHELLGYIERLKERMAA